jgi:hypothetical protein
MINHACIETWEPGLRKPDGKGNWLYHMLPVFRFNKGKRCLR